MRKIVSDNNQTVFFLCIRRKVLRPFLSRFAPVSTLATAEPTRCKPCRLARNAISEY